MFFLPCSASRSLFLFASLMIAHNMSGEICMKKTTEERAKEFFFLSRQYREQNQWEKVVEQLRNAVKEDPAELVFWQELAHALCMVNCYDEALAIYQHILEKNASGPCAMYNIGNVLKFQGHIDEAIETYEKVIALTAANEQIHKLAHFALGISCLARGTSDVDWIDGWRGYEWRWHATGLKKEQYLGKPLWDGSDLTGKTILVMDEQGFGDIFQFIRYVKYLKNPQVHVVFMCRPALKKFLQTACDYIDEVVCDGDLMPTFDCQIHLLSLPGIFKTIEKTVPTDIPYLKADSELVNYWKERLSIDKNFKIGLCWQGNPKISTQVVRQIFADRSISLKLLLTVLAKVPGCSFYSLQKMDGMEQFDELQSMPIYGFGNDFDEAHGRFMDTAALMMNLDLVISVDTSVAHLAGALGVRTWILLPTPSDWRWMIGRLDTPWYPTVRLFRQLSAGDWDGVLEIVAKELNQFEKH